MAQHENSFSDIVKRVETKWQVYWDSYDCFKAVNPGEKGSEKPKFYILDMFPYPSGDGLHIGHPLGYTATDILSRYKRSKGFNVLHPMGWDAFGLPAEQYAIKHGVHPADTTQKNIITFKRQLKSLGFSYDWSREISTMDPKYFRWTQWIFKRLHERGLAYEAEMQVNWCPALGTVLANDEVIDGKSERGAHPVEKRPMRQWVLRITEYAERLLSDLDKVDWPESTKEHQRNWIGKSVGARLKFKTSGSDTLEVFTTRPDTLFGVSFLALAPEHSLVRKLTIASQKTEVEAYISAASKKTDIQRTDLAKGKSGVFLGSYALHPLTGKNVPIWIADYILVNYGTGAIMGVPAHDERDQEFAEAMNLPILSVIDENDRLINSTSEFDGLEVKQGALKIVEKLEKSGQGQSSITYRLRDWIFSRQRYWGEPIPVIKILEGPHKGETKFLGDDELPLTLPKVERYEPTGTGESPLASLKEWVQCKDPKTGALAHRETNTMPGSAGSSWYWLRYMDPQNTEAAWGAPAEKYWGQVDLYVGGSEHAVGHLLYARFWQKVFFDMGLVSSEEPFKKVVHQGMILAEDGEKMSKSRGNVVNPDQVIAQYGADTLRLFEMFLGPLEKAKPWQTNSIEGVYRFLQRYWRLCVNEAGTALSENISDAAESTWDAALVQGYHKCIQQVSEDVEAMRFNTAISAMMTFVNELYGVMAAGKQVPRLALEKLTLLLAPFAPHLAEEVWQLMGHSQTLTFVEWPIFDVTKTSSDEFELAIQVNGKLRATLKVSKKITEAELKPIVLGLDAVTKWSEGKVPKKFIYVKEKLVSVVV
jgi:leucyl-tRNA synthetase